MKYCVLYNPKAGNGRGLQKADSIKEIIKGKTLQFTDVTAIEDWPQFLAGIDEEDAIVLCGGDGTINHFINDVDYESIKQELLYFPAGSGNDFMNDVSIWEEGPVVDLKKYLNNLPKVVVNGKTHKFINGVGFGIDGYCCEIGDQARRTSDKPVDYTGIAIKGLLFHFKPVTATVTVDGKETVFKNAWLSPTMFGRCYGGGMIAAPNQNRLDPEHPVSVMLFHGFGRLRTLIAFPSIFKGEHVKKTHMVKLISGHDICVSFDRPCALQIDGETILNVKSYHVIS